MLEETALFADILGIHSDLPQKDLEDISISRKWGDLTHLADGLVQYQESRRIRGTEHVVDYEPQGPVHPGVRRRGDGREDGEHLGLVDL